MAAVRDVACECGDGVAAVRDVDCECGNSVAAVRDVACECGDSVAAVGMWPVSVETVWLLWGCGL